MHLKKINKTKGKTFLREKESSTWQRTQTRPPPQMFPEVLCIHMAAIVNQYQSILESDEASK